MIPGDVFKFVPKREPEKYTIAYVVSMSIKENRGFFKTIISKTGKQGVLKKDPWEYTITEDDYRFDIELIGSLEDYPEYLL